MGELSREASLQRVMRASGRVPVQCSCSICKQQCHTPCLGTPDDIAGYVEERFKYYKDDCQILFDKMYRKHEERIKKKIRFWKYLFAITFFMLLIECICRIVQ